ncbi:unnamed protein product [Haemonchus placei]|uniref:BHLH domain-containing protein n=1 Tax=Haemonchus placei TaxID=6290 RepID=A0A0N4WCP8_HAEPC|nr:unnamed protein product [Haemonchus placei]
MSSHGDLQYYKRPDQIDDKMAKRIRDLEQLKILLQNNSRTRMIKVVKIVLR